MAQFVDRAVLHLQAGDGGHGCVSVHREKFKPLGGPDGGNGGHGGDIVLEVSNQVHTLLDFQYRPHVRRSAAAMARVITETAPAERTLSWRSQLEPLCVVRTGKSSPT